MFAQVMNGFAEQAKMFYEPALEVNRIALNQMQKLGQKQLALTNEYMKLGLTQLEQVGQVQNLVQLGELAQQQLKASAEVSGKLVKDAQSLMDLGQEMSSEWLLFVESRLASFSIQPEQPKTGKAR